jgi:hypothetical protein
MGLNAKGFMNHMLLKKNIWKPDGMTVNEHFCVFLFGKKEKVDLVHSEMSAFNSYYQYDMYIHPDGNSICIMNDRNSLSNLVKAQNSE